MFRNLFPDNMVTACMHLFASDVTLKNVTVDNVTSQVEVFANKPVDALNIMGELDELS